MVLERTFRFTRKAGQWVSVFGLALAALGLIAWLLAILNHPQPFLLDLGIMALPVIFVGLVCFFIAAGIEQILIRRRPPSA
jgi:hypothetical protein